MRTNKNTHSFRPFTENAFRKTDRVYPTPKSIYQKNDTEAPTQPKSPATQQVNYIDTQQSPSIIVSKNASGYRRYYFLAKDPAEVSKNIHKQIPTVDKTCLWSLPIENPIYKDGIRSIKIVSADLIFKDWYGDTYANVYYICADSLEGYYDQNGRMTPRIAALQLVEIAPSVEGTKNYDLRYALKTGLQWGIPIGINNVNLRLMTEEGKFVELPLQNHLPIQVEIKNK